MVVSRQWSQRQPEVSGDKSSDSQSLSHLLYLPSRVGLGIYNFLYLAVPDSSDAVLQGVRMV